MITPVVTFLSTRLVTVFVTTVVVVVAVPSLIIAIHGSGGEGDDAKFVRGLFDSLTA